MQPTTPRHPGPERGLHRPRMSLLAGLAGLAPLVACGGSTLSQPWQLDRLRVLAVQAEPAEPRPGDTVTFSSLVYAPEGVEVAGAVWFACLPQDADDFGCELDDALLAELEAADPETMSEEELLALYQEAREAGLIGFEPGLPPSWEAPAEALDGLDDTERLEGRSAVINVSVFPAGVDGDDDLSGEVEVVYKRLPVSEAVTPNTNPGIEGFLVNGVEVESGGRLVVDPRYRYELEPLLREGSVETYEYLGSDGEVEERTEEPYFSWYTEAGSFDQEYSLYPYSEAVWTPGDAWLTEAPPEGGEVRILAVVRDRRGGMAWGELTLVVQ